MYKPPYTVQIKVFDKDFQEIWNAEHEGEIFTATDLTAKKGRGDQFEIYTKAKELFNERNTNTNNN